MQLETQHTVELARGAASGTESNATGHAFVLYQGVLIAPMQRGFTCL